jgi:hypothetical protein
VAWGALVACGALVAVAAAPPPQAARNSAQAVSTLRKSAKRDCFFME